MPTQAFTNSFSRVWFQEGGPGPSRNRVYHGNWRAGAITWGRGDLTVIREPDPNVYNKFIRVGRFRAEPADPEMPIMARFGFQRSALMKAARGDCEHALHVHMGQCENPQDFARGWQKVVILEGAAITNYGTAELGAMTPADNTHVDETVPFRGVDLYEVTRMTFAQQATALTTREMTAIRVCDTQQCGLCGVSDGCRVVLALQGAVVGSPGQSPTIVYTRDGGATWAQRPVSSLAANQGATVLACLGSNVVVMSVDSNSLHYMALTDFVNGVGSFAQVTQGFVTAKGPLSLWSLGATENWISAQGGYIYFMDDPTNGVTVNQSGGVTTNDLNDIHAFDSNNIVAVGAANTILRTTNGGVSWTLVTGPAPAVVLNCVWLISPTEWLVGTAAGRMYYTADAGNTWTEKLFSGSGSGQVRDIEFVTPSVGFMAHSTTAPAGRIFRTIDGGYSWYLMPEGPGTIPTNQYVARLATCGDPNIVYGAGLATGVAGFLVKGA